MLSNYFFMSISVECSTTSLADFQQDTTCSLHVLTRARISSRRLILGLWEMVVLSVLSGILPSVLLRVQSTTPFGP